MAWPMTRDLDLLYFGTGNGVALESRDCAAPAAAMTCISASIIAVNPDTGEYVWHYQETPGDDWD